jgi:nucleoside-diphosphate-sugar epimerase
MMYMEDAIRATLEIMNAPAEQIKERSSYNLSGMSFTPEQLAAQIQKHLPDFTIDYEPDSRQQIADSWPSSIDDQTASKDWNWKSSYDLEKMVVEMLQHLR